MKVSILLLVFGTAVTTAKFIPSFFKYHEGKRFILFPDGNDKLHVVDLEDFGSDKPRFDANKDCVLYLYTRNNPTNPDKIINGDGSSLQKSHFDPKKPVKIVIHGWNSGATHDINTEITSKFLDALDVNVFFVDWSSGASGLYTIACLNVPKIGNYVAMLVDWLAVTGVPIDNFHILGHSLGAHAAGIAGRGINSGIVPYITAFDPAFPLWTAESERIRKTDAKYVEVIHTNAGNLGLNEAVGHADFYPNGGVSQPGCSINIACSHSRSYHYFAYSLDNVKFMASQCNSVEELQDGKCANLSSLHMGGSKPKTSTGVFYLKTNSNPPYYLG